MGYDATYRALANVAEGAVPAEAAELAAMREREAIRQWHRDEVAHDIQMGRYHDDPEPADDHDA
jgi:hypothetical protein